MTLAVFGTIAAELVGSTAGVGTRIKTYDGLIRVDYVIALVVSLGVFGLLVYFAMERLDVAITFWAHERAGRDDGDVDETSAATENGRRPHRISPSHRRIGVVAGWSGFVFVAFIGIWDGITRLGLIHAIVLPPPADVESASSNSWHPSNSSTHLSATVFETVAGFIFGALPPFHGAHST